MPELIQHVALQSINPSLFLAGMGLIYASGLILLAAAALKFIEHSRNPQPLAKTRTHFFSTREMLVGVLAQFPFWLNSIAQLSLGSDLQCIYFGIGVVMMGAAVAWHVWAKTAIRHMWSDGIEIKRGHQLVTTGPYALARHPMYGSLLLWCWGASLMMFNWASLLIAGLVLLPLMIKRAKDEETELLRAQPDYVLYQQNAPMLTPKLSGAPGLAIRAAAILLFGYSVFTGLAGPSLLLLCGLHLYLGFCLVPEKVAFSYRSKSGLTVFFWVMAQLWHPFYYFLYLILAMFIYGMKFNCPCMIVYEKYHRCPCFGWMKSCLAKFHP